MMAWARTIPTGNGLADLGGDRNADVTPDVDGGDTEEERLPVNATHEGTFRVDGLGWVLEGDTDRP